jgi:hypothetical protein
MDIIHVKFNVCKHWRFVWLHVKKKLYLHVYLAKQQGFILFHHKTLHVFFLKKILLFLLKNPSFFIIKS